MSIRMRAASALGVVFVLHSVALAQTAPASATAPTAPQEAASPGPNAPASPPLAPALAQPAEPQLAPEPVAEAVPGSVEPVPAGVAKVGYEKGFFIESADGNFRTAIGARMQLRYTYVEVEGGPDSSAFAIERARLKLEGFAFTKDLTYVFQPELGKGSVSLKDFYGDYRVVPEWLHVRAGQWTKPFSRQQITSDGNQELVDRSITDNAFGAGRDIGLAVHNNFEKSPELEYALGLFNGTSERSTTSVAVETDATTGDVSASVGSTTNVPRMFHPELVGRLGYNYGGIKGYSEVDLEGGGLRFGVGASGQVDFDADRDNDSQIRGEIDAILKVQGLSSTGGVYVSSVQAGEGFSDRALGAVGFHLQAGYLIAQKVQPAVRIAIVAPDGEDNDQRELALCLGYFPFGHNLKWQTEIAALSSQASDTTDARVRSQLQLGF